MSNQLDLGHIVDLRVGEEVWFNHVLIKNHFLLQAVVTEAYRYAHDQGGLDVHLNTGLLSLRKRQAKNLDEHMYFCSDPEHLDRRLRKQAQENLADTHPSNRKHYLYGEQEGRCAMCDALTDFRLMDVDHITPRAKGGDDSMDNLQVLCRPCNLAKGSGDDNQAKMQKIKEMEQQLRKLKANAVPAE